VLFILQGNSEEKVLTRIACSKLMQQKIARWRREHEDWEALAAFALSKNTGRRFKNKPHSDTNSAFDVSISSEKTGENVVPPNSASNDTSVHSNSIQDDEILGSDSVTLDNESWHTSSDKLQMSKHVLSASHRNQQMAERSQKPGPSDGLGSVLRRDVVVKQISLDDLSGELFLPQPDEDDASVSVEAALPSSRTKIGKGFFVVSSDEESIDGESPASAALAEDSDDDDDDDVSGSVLQSSIKLSTRFAKSLSHRQPRNTVRGDNIRKSSLHQNHRQNMIGKKHSERNGGKRFSDKQFTKSRGSFPNTHSSRYPSKNEKSSHGNANMWKYNQNTKYVNPVTVTL